MNNIRFILCLGDKLLLGLQYCLLRGLGNRFGLPNHLIPVTWGGWGYQTKISRVWIAIPGIVKERFEFIDSLIGIIANNQ
jgi:hypothetical protein